MSDNVFIYALIDPRTGAIRYVGKATDVRKRVRDHQHQSRLEAQRSCHRAAWLLALARESLQPKVIVLEQVAKAEWQERERFWIKHLHDNGCDLTNGAPGGEGGPTMTGRKRSPASAETRAKISASKTGKHPAYNRSEEATRRRGAAIHAAALRRKAEGREVHWHHSGATKKRLSQAWRMTAGRAQSVKDSGRAKRGRPWTTAQRAARGGGRHGSLGQQTLLNN